MTNSSAVMHEVYSFVGDSQTLSQNLAYDTTGRFKFAYYERVDRIAHPKHLQP